MQPIVLKIVDKNGFGDDTSGIAPTTPFPESMDDLGILGNPNEPLLNTAINQIIGSGRPTQPRPNHMERDFADVKTMAPLRTEMYIERN